MSIILTSEELQRMISTDNEIIIIDVRTKENDFHSGEQVYQHSHLPNALFLNVAKDLTGEYSFLPEPKKLAIKLGNMGINKNAVIVFYDNGNHRAASKAWFVMQYLGHGKVYILQGGFTSWVEAGNETTAAIPKRKPAIYISDPQKDLVIGIDDVKEKLMTDQSILIDSRAAERYAGNVEPKYKKAGHIPGAINFQAKHVFDDKGLWKNKEELKAHFARIEVNDNVTVSCGSGNSACMNMVALKEAGFKHVTLYPGGFSEWIKDDENEVEQGIRSQK